MASPSGHRYKDQNGLSQGPYGAAAMFEWYAQGWFTPDTLICTVGLQGFLPLEKVSKASGRASMPAVGAVVCLWWARQYAVGGHNSMTVASFGYASVAHLVDAKFQ